MRKILITLIFALAVTGTNLSAMTFKAGDDTIDLYASIRAYAVFTYTNPGETFSICGRPAGKNCSQFAIGMQDNSRAGIRWTKGNMFLNNEWGIGGPTGNKVDDGTTHLRLRFLYGDYKFEGGDKGRIRIGQLPGVVHTSSFYDTKFSADHALQGFGTIDDVRRIGINYQIGGFSVAALSMIQDRGVIERLGSGTFVEIMPRVEVAYKISDVTMAGTFVKTSARGGDDKLYSANAGHIMLAANPKISDNVRFVASGFYSVNGGMYGMVSIGGGYSKSEALKQDDWGAIPIARIENEKIEFDNTVVYGGAIALAHSNFEAGFGIQGAGNDSWEDNQTSMGVYANYKYRVSNFRVTPEIGYLHSGDKWVLKGGETGRKASKGFRFGVQFRFDI